MKRANKIPTFKDPRAIKQQRRLADCRSIVRMPRGGAMTEHLRRLARLELLQHEMFGR